jgi:hypothetical protein
VNLIWSFGIVLKFGAWNLSGIWMLGFGAAFPGAWMLVLDA